RDQAGGVRGGGGRLQEGQGFGRGVVGQRELAGGEAAGVDLLRGTVGLAERVVPGGGVDVARITGVDRFEYLGDALVQPAQRVGPQVGQERFPDPVVQERVPPRAGRGHQQACLRLGE